MDFPCFVCKYQILARIYSIIPIFIHFLQILVQVFFIIKEPKMFEIYLFSSLYLQECKVRISDCAVSQSEFLFIKIWDLKFKKNICYAGSAGEPSLNKKGKTPGESRKKGRHKNGARQNYI